MQEVLKALEDNNVPVQNRNYFILNFKKFTDASINTLAEILYQTIIKDECQIPRNISVMRIVFGSFGITENNQTAVFHVLINSFYRFYFGWVMHDSVEACAIMVLHYMELNNMKQLDSWVNKQTRNKQLDKIWTTGLTNRYELFFSQQLLIFDLVGKVLEKKSKIEKRAKRESKEAARSALDRVKRSSTLDSNSAQWDGLNNLLQTKIEAYMIKHNMQFNDVQNESESESE